MSQTKRIIRCPVCDVQVAEDARVCFACGHLLTSAETAWIPSPEEVAPTETVVDSAPTTKIVESVVTVDVREDKKAEDKPSADGTSLLTGRLFSRVLVFAVALIMLILALSSPLSRSYMTDSRNGEHSIGFTALDSVDLVSYSMKAYSDRQISKTPEYSNYLTLTEQLLDFEAYGWWDKISAIEEDISRNSLYLTLMSRDVSLEFDILLAAVASVLQLIAIVLFFLAALVSLAIETVNELLGTIIKFNAHKLTLILLWIAVAILPLCGYAHSQLAYFGLGEHLGGFSSAGSGLSTGFVFLAIVGVLGAIYSVIYCLAPKFEKSRFQLTAKARPVIATVCIALVMFISLLSPMLTVKLANPVSPDSTTSFGVSASELFFTTAEDIGYYTKTSSKTNINKITETINAVFSGDDAASTDTLINDLVTGVRRVDNSMLYLIMQISIILALCIFAVFIVLFVRKYLLSHSGSKAFNVFKVLLMVVCFAVAVIAIVITVITSSAVTHDLSFVLAISIAAAPILLIISTVAMAFTFRTPKTVNSYVEYDDPDTSYAPYVVFARKKKRY